MAGMYSYIRTSEFDLRGFPSVIIRIQQYTLLLYFDVLRRTRTSVSNIYQAFVNTYRMYSLVLSVRVYTCTYDMQYEVRMYRYVRMRQSITKHHHNRLGQRQQHSSKAENKRKATQRLDCVASFVHLFAYPSCMIMLYIRIIY